MKYKKIALLLLSGVLLFASLSGHVSAVSREELVYHRLLGDVTRDGINSNQDLARLKGYLADSAIDLDAVAADINEDTYINNKDYARLKATLADPDLEVHRPVTTDGYANYNAIYPKTADGAYLIHGQAYEQTFYDDFEGTTLNRKNWGHCPEWTRHDGNVWRNDMTWLDGNGNLILSVGKENNYYKTGAIRSKDLFYQKYGYFEIRCMLQQYSPGFWGAFWLMPDSIDSGIAGGSDGTEIDIFESAYFVSDRINHAVHFDGYGAGHQTIGTNVHVRDIYYGFHVFGFEWTENSYVWYIDGEETYRLTRRDVDISQVESYLKVTVEAGTWAGKVNDSALPDGLTVDYVKVYQRVG